jgi:membrane fusion protein, heavy metal efflux system
MKTAKMALHRTAHPRSLLILLLCLGVSCSSGEEGDGHDDHEGHGEEEAHVEGRVELSEQQIALAGIEVQRAGPQDLAVHLTLPAVVSMDADASTHVTPKVPGIIRSIHKHLGERVEAGELLCSIDSVELGGTVADLVLANSLVDAAKETLTKEQALFIQRLATADEVLSGAIEVNDSIYRREKELQQKGVSTIRPLLEAEKALKNSRLAKEQGLSDLRAEQATRMLALDVQLREKRILAEGAKNRLLALGIDEKMLVNVDSSSPLLSGTYEIHAARSGIIAGRHITAGEYVDTGTRLFRIEDLSRVWIIGSVFEQQVQSVRTGQEAVVVLNSFPDMTFAAKVAVVGYEADPESRAIGVRLELLNPELADWPEEYPIRPGMFASVKLETAMRSVRVAIPESAIVHGDDGDSVFVRVGEGVFQEKPVTVSSDTGEIIEVLSGLEPGEEVAVTGTFMLKSTAGKEELGGGHSH